MGKVLAMRALVTNDDGANSEGIQVLARAAEDAGMGVLLAAPSWNSSGASASLTAVLEHGRFGYRHVEVDGIAGDCLAVDGAPSFIVRAALGGAFGDPPDVVLSGINLGLNAGQAILHSGTVGAVMTGATYHRPGIAFSLDRAEDVEWDAARQVVDEVLGWWTEHARPGLVLNVNIPDAEPDAVRGLCSAPLAEFGAVTATLTSRESGSVLMHYESPTGDPEPGTDVALVREGWATVTALQPLCAAPEQPALGPGHRSTLR